MMNDLLFLIFNDTTTTEIYTLSLHDALPISPQRLPEGAGDRARRPQRTAVEHWPAGRRYRPAPRLGQPWRRPDRKSKRLKSSHANRSYAGISVEEKKERKTGKGGRFGKRERK